MLRALIIDDEKAICTALAGVISDEGWETDCCYDGVSGIATYKKKRPDLVLLDIWMQGMDGIQVLQSIRNIDKETPVVIMSGHANVEMAVRATKLGALDVLEKPLSIDKLIPILETVSKRQKIAHSSHDVVELVGDSELITNFKEQLLKIAQKDARVLITGENGTGKEVTAKFIHHNSSRSQQPFVAINCAAIPESLIESELFGHEKGAFTGASSLKKGKFEQADGGTLLLDEVADMSLSTQAKVLRVLEEQSVERLGGGKTIQVDVRVLAATNKDLKEAISEGEFREDLFYRLNVIPVEVPALRDRAEDVIALAEFFLKEICLRLGEQEKSFSEDVKDIMMKHGWPGNVRELRNMIERLVVLTANHTIEVDDLPEHLQNIVAPQNEKIDFVSTQTWKEAKTAFERDYLLSQLEKYDWNISKTAQAIGLERSHLHKKIKSYHIKVKNS